MEEWDVIAPVDIPQHRYISSILDKGSILGKITHGIGTTMTSMGKGIVQSENNF